ncbi:MAG TPA: class I SAM-dependent methyltransferase [Candidatus Binataceae bacterium]|jgi:2-polyprenyl-3-methyl-5-hydroxy-6-metoxy-1,4-benzoquinol methylase
MAIDTKTLDWSKVRKFSEQLSGDIAAVMHGAMSWIGDRLGIFKAMMEAGPITLEDLAVKANLNQRYLKEWLGSMVAAKYIEYQADAKTYFLPPEHAVSLADEDSLFFFGGFIGGIIPNLSVTPKVADAFRSGKGVSISDYPAEVFASLERSSGPLYKHRLVQQWVPAMPAVKAKLESGGAALDVGCGCGRAAITLAKGFPKSRFYGFDAHPGSIDRARNNAKAASVEDRVTFEVVDCTKLPQKKFDFITTFEVVHDAVDPLGLLSAIRGALVPDGTYLMDELNVSANLEDNINNFARMLYSVSTLYCLTTSLAHGGAGIGALMGEPKARELAQRAGFTQFNRLPIKDNFFAFYELRP